MYIDLLLITCPTNKQAPTPQLRWERISSWDINWGLWKISQSSHSGFPSCQQICTTSQTGSDQRMYQVFPLGQKLMALLWPLEREVIFFPYLREREAQMCSSLLSFCSGCMNREHLELFSTMQPDVPNPKEESQPPREGWIRETKPHPWAKSEMVS